MAETRMQLVDWLDDLCVRFIINLPHEELTSVERICFQIEEAQWFYEDFIRTTDPTLPSMNLRRFCELIFQHCPLLAPFQASAALSYAEFLAYKTRVPVRGAILLNEDMTEVVLVKGWSKKAKWSFPRGKINKEERDLDCAIREVYEETGYDVKAAGLIDEKEEDVKYIDMALREQQMRLYVFRHVPMDTVFEPKTRKEISKIDWFKVSELAATGNQKQAPQQQQQQQYGPVSQDALKASQFYMVAPFIRPLRHWIKQQRKLDQAGGRKERRIPIEAEQPPMVFDDGMMTTDAEDDTHFQRLLSGLQGPQQQAPSLPIQSEAASTADLSAQLKAVLSVGGPVAAPQPSQSNPLMSALFAKQGQMPPHTPIEQLTSTPPHARTPHHHHPRPPPPYSEMPPPPHFPISPQHMQHGPMQGQYSAAPPLPHWQQQHAQQSMRTHMPPMPPPHAQQHQQPSILERHRGLFGASIPAPPPIPIVNPLQTGDPEFRNSQHFPQYNQAPSQQSMPKPPPQKLTNHAMNLLNVFKSPSTADVQPALPSPGQLPELAEPMMQMLQEKPILPSQLLSGVSQQRQTSPQIHQPRAQRNAHQDSLLNLFKAAATPVVSQQSNAPPVELAAQPSPNVQREPPKQAPHHKLSMRRLPNVNTTGLPRPKSNERDPVTSATVTGPLNAPDFETVRKNQPNTLPGRPIEMGNGLASPSPGTIAPQSTFTIMQRPASQRQQQRPSSQARATPPVPVHRVGEGLEMSAPRPFHPTSILRRGEQDIDAMAREAKREEMEERQRREMEREQQAQIQAQAQAQMQEIKEQLNVLPMQQTVPLRGSGSGVSALPQPPSFDRRDSSNQAQKSALLSLFVSPTAQPQQKPTDHHQPSQKSPAEFPGSLPISAIPPHAGIGHGQGHARASGIGSPVSPLPTRRQDTGSGGSKDITRSSRISSINSVPGDLPMLGMGTAPTSMGAATSSSSMLLGGMPVTSAPVQMGVSEHGQSMLNLFKSATSASAKATPPITAATAAAAGGVAGSGSAAQSLVTSKRGSMASEAGGMQSPITPVEKNFLLGYLAGVVKKKGGGRQNSLK